ncbi:hypothetical protein EOPP23_10805 [Endozoicomonas sp. OPT23]|uniref:hypothetical protein n=1 Tax=Endozoicomonas sp. OPT23 TaxID=2072845 RepID=UPI00129A20DE|nr:hypothetical protein [Endozoicomonas sp. OPT23]MRI33474.1 hypothetical protein [Endozoicomonas sp. OPT23]
MSIEDINNRPQRPETGLDPELGRSTQDSSEQEVDITFEELRSYVEEMLQFNYGSVHELMAQVAAVAPVRPDTYQGKQPDVAAIDAVNQNNTQGIAPVEATGSVEASNKLRLVEGMMGEQDLQLQQIFDALALSRAGRKPDPDSLGIEYERLTSIMIQAEGRKNQILSQLPETLPHYTQHTAQQQLPELITSLQKYDASFREALMEIRTKLNQQ